MTWLSLIVAGAMDPTTPLGKWGRYALAFAAGAIVVWLL